MARRPCLLACAVCAGLYACGSLGFAPGWHSTLPVPSPLASLWDVAPADPIHVAPLLSVASLVIWAWRWRSARTPPCGPSVLELLGARATEQESWAAKYGKIFETWTPFGSVVSLSDPAASRYVAVRKGNNYREPCVYGRDQRLSQRIEEALGPGSSFPSFEDWRWRKQSLQGELSFQRLLQPEMLRALEELGEEMCQSLAEAAKSGELVEMNEIFSRATAGAVLQLLFGRRPAFDARGFEESTEEVMECLQGLLLPVHLPGQKEELLAKRGHAHRVMDDVLQPELQKLLQEVDSGEASARAPCLLEAMMRKEPRWRRADLLAEVRNFVNAGYEIQAFALSFTVGFLSEKRHEALAKEAHREAVSITSCGFTENLLSKTEGFQAMFNEALRLLPPTPALTGVAYDDFEVSVDGRDYLISKDTTLNFQVFAGQRQRSDWECPLHFKPERWQGTKTSKLMTYNFGAHSCPGRDMSSLEARVWLPMLLSRFRFELPGERMEVDFSGVHLKPKDGLQLRVFSVSP